LDGGEHRRRQREHGVPAEESHVERSRAVGAEEARARITRREVRPVGAHPNHAWKTAMQSMYCRLRSGLRKIEVRVEMKGRQRSIML